MLSKDYRRLTWLIHLVAVVAVLRSGLSWSVSLLGLGIIVIGMVKMLASPPFATERLSYHTSSWFLHSQGGPALQYEHVKISFDGGLFLVLTLQGISPKKTRVVFYDQLSIEEMRGLRLIDSRKAT